MNAPLTNDQTLAAIQEKATITKSDRFLVKVSRRRNSGAQFYTHEVTVGEATVNHIANAESWISQLVGGGDFALGVYHMDEQTTRIGGQIQFTLRTEVREMDWRVMQSREWNGPSLLLYPPMGDGVVQPTRGPVFSNGYDLPVRGGQQPQQPQVAGISPQAQYEFDRRKVELDAQEARLRAESEARRREDEERRRKVEAEELRQSLKREQDEAIARMRAEAPKPGGGMEGLVAALAPFLSEIIKGNQQNAERQHQMALRQMELAANKPKDDTALMYMELMKSQSEQSLSMVTRITEVMGTFSKISIGMIETMAEMTAGDPPNPMMEMVREVVKGVSQLQEGASKTANQRPKLPPNGQAIVDKPAPKPNQPPASDTAAKPRLPLVDAIEKLVRLRHEPVEQVAVAFVNGIQKKDASLLGALQAVDGDPGALLQQRLGGWLMVDVNLNYAKRLGEAIDVKLKQAGLLKDEDEIEESEPEAEEPEAEGEVVEAAPAEQPVEAQPAEPSEKTS